jgi:hypothetical protein
MWAAAAADEFSPSKKAERIAIFGIAILVPPI